MTRLTRKVDKEWHYEIDYHTIDGDHTALGDLKFVNKLGQLEDIEEELGIDLIKIMNKESITVQFTEEQLKIIRSDLQAACYERCGLKKLYGKSKKAVIKSLEKQIKDREILVDIIEEKLKNERIYKM